MLLAFIHNPVQTGFFYLVEIILVSCAYLFSLPFTNCFSTGFKPVGGHNNFVFCYLLISLALSVVIFVMVMLFVLTLGSFSDFEQIQNLVLPLVVAIFGILIAKSGIKSMMSNHSGNDDNDDDENDSRMEQETDQELNDITVQRNNHTTNQNEE